MLATKGEEIEPEVLKKRVEAQGSHLATYNSNLRLNTPLRIPLAFLLSTRPREDASAVSPLSLLLRGLVGVQDGYSNEAQRENFKGYTCILLANMHCARTTNSMETADEYEWWTFAKMVRELGEALAKDLKDRHENADPTHAGRFVRALLV